MAANLGMRDNENQIRKDASTYIPDAHVSGARADVNHNWIADSLQKFLRGGLALFLRCISRTIFRVHDFMRSAIACA
ncbi:MAG TPA: hypothetical protein VNW52_07595, partial [Burkholderiaceae bacterium]|nr:hypothetical protein [Burkholderiaceae bacterium]